MTDYVRRIDPRRDPEWRSRLTRLQYHVTREAGTEMPNTGIYNMEDRDGSYYCICCGHILFTAGLGIAGLFLETHPDPDKAKCDGPCALPLKHLKEFLYQIKAIDKLVKTFSEIEIS